MNNLTRVIIRTLIFTFFVILIDNTIQVHFFGTTANCRESNQIVNNSGIDMSTGMPIEPEELSPQTDLIYQTSFISSREFWLSLIILLFGLIVICAEYSLLKSKAVTAEEILKIFAVTLIVVGTLFLITASFNNNQIAPAMGLFGTIAGYLLGKKTNREKNDKEIS